MSDGIPLQTLDPKLGTWYSVSMRVIARRTLPDFIASLQGHTDQAAVKSALQAWFDEARKAEWSGPAELKQHYANASVINAERVVFNIKGNSCRLVAAIDYARGIVFIKWIGSHRDYDRIDVASVRHGD